MTKIFRVFLFVTMLSFSLAVFAQDKFTSDEGGFAIDLPAEGITVNDKPEGADGLGEGKKYSWLTLEDRVFMISYYKTADEKPLTLKERANLMTGVKAGFIKGVKKNKYLVSEKPYAYKTYKGTQFRVVLPGGISITRIFMTPMRMYMTQTTVKGTSRAKELAAVKVLDTFRLITPG